MKTENLSLGEWIGNPKRPSPKIKKKHKKQQHHHHQISKQGNALTLHYSNLTISGWLTLTLCDWEMSAGDHLVDDDDANATKLIKTSKVVHGSDQKNVFIYWFYQFVFGISSFISPNMLGQEHKWVKIRYIQSHIKDTNLYKRPLLPAWLDLVPCGNVLIKSNKHFGLPEKKIDRNIVHIKWKVK